MRYCEDMRRWGKWLGGIILGAFVLVLVLPTYFSTRLGTKQLCYLVGKSQGAQLTVDHLSLSWFGGQEAEGFKYRSKQTDLDFKRFVTDSSLLALVLTKRANDTQLIEPDVTMRIFSEAKKRKTQAAFFLPFKGGVKIKSGKLSVVRRQLKTAELFDVDIDLNIADGSLPIMMDAVGKTAYDSTTGGFTVRASVEKDREGSVASKWLTSNLGLPKTSNLKYSLDGDFSNFPLLGFDELVFDGWLTKVIGPSVNLKAQGALGGTSNNLRLNIASQGLNGNINIDAPNAAWVITSGSNLSVSTSNLPISETVLIKQLGPSTIQFEDVRIPIENPRATSGKITANATSASLLHETLDTPITFSNINVQLMAENLAKNVMVTTNSQILFQDTQGSINTSFSWTKPLDQPLSAYDLLKGSQTNIVNLPVSLFGTNAVRYVGPTLNLKVNSESDLLDIDMASRLINSKTMHLKITPTALILSQPVQVNYTLKDPKLTRPFNLNVALSELVVPQIWQNTRFKGSITAPQLSFKPLPHLGQIDFTDFGMALTAPNLNSMSFMLESRMQHQLEIGDPNLEVSSSGTLDLETWDISGIKLQALGKTTKLTTYGAITGGGKRLNLTETSTLRANIKPDLIKPYLKNIRLKAPALATLTLDPIAIDLQTYETLTPIKAQIQADQFMLKSKKTSFKVTDFNGIIDLSDTRKLAAAGGINSGSFDINAYLNQDTIDRLEIALKDFPVKLLDQVTGDDGDLIHTFGQTISLDLEYQTSRVSVDLDSDKLDIHGTLEIDDNMRVYNAIGPLKVRYLLTQSSYAHVFEESRFKLAQACSINLDIARLSLPLKTLPTYQKPLPAIDWNLQNILIDARSQIDSMSFLNAKGKPAATLENFSIDLDHLKPNQPLSFKSKGSVSKKQQKGHMRLDGTIDDFYNKKGKFSTKNLSTTYQGVLDNVPTTIFNAFFPNTSKIFGKTLSATISADIKNQNGTFDAEILSKHAKADIEAYVRSGVLSLRSPLIADVVLTPGLSSLLLSDAKLTVVSAKKPVRITILPQNTAIPMRNFQWKNVRIGAGQIDFGQLIVASKGTAADLIDMFKLQSSNQVPMWFAPLDFRIQNGVMGIGRTEILYDLSYQIATWGRIDFNRSYVDMTLGLTAQSLNRAFGLILPPDYVLTVDMKGPFGNVKVDKGAAIAKIALIVAGNTGLVPQEGIAGGVFGIIQGFAHDQSDVPPPKRPFPWER